MPIKPSQVLAQLQAKQAAFQQFDQVSFQFLNQYRQAWHRWVADVDIQGKMLAVAPAAGGLPPVNLASLSAILLEPLTQHRQGLLTAHLSWPNREASRQWVEQQLTGVATFAVDGSQIYPSRDLSLPIALVQIGWFENQHLPQGSYTKDIRVEVMTPTELQLGSSGEPVDRRVNLRRFQMETTRLIEYIQAHEGSETCLVFFDGSLVATFAEAFEAEIRNQYVACLCQLLQASETCRVPLVSYIDTSYARDLVEMLQCLYDLPEATTIHDAQLLNPLLKERWGDRTPLFRCQRSGILQQYQEYRDRIGFTYLKTTQDGYPARIELPLWIYEAGRLEQVINWVRAEVMIGGGYPYVIETADQVAVLQADDRQIFYRLLQDWAEAANLNLRLSRKMISKVRRR
ncbi:DNA double-strand break repair nuclease NurA [Trichothermofontia sichuanensis B231]|uniref:DNA double-strand break repair nuclease NurA n=1 Tax=Trichothermofontia sichuanensis TaxID=3045816 RepID=UPI002246A58E|nr:DNA double-strand break repair nuclease NurA [Trichothermofontia sichuanensis]UZQ53350.1 DNA double-strand break repair nuclease NurA [Trichothermofontia sichuanensis B231]